MAAVPAIVVGLSLVGAAAGAGISYAQAQESNRNARRAKQRQREASAVEAKQVVRAGNIERERRIIDRRRAVGAIQAAAGETGFSFESGNFDPLIDQTGRDTQYNLDVLGGNVAGQLARTQSGLNANLAELTARMINPTYSTAAGAVGGFSTGLSVGSAFQSAELAGMERDRLRAAQRTQAIQAWDTFGGFPQ